MTLKLIFEIFKILEITSNIVNEGQFLVPILIALAVGILVGTRLWILFKK